MTVDDRKVIELSKQIMMTVKCLNDLLRAAQALPDVEVQINIHGHFNENQEKPVQEVVVRLLKEI